MMSLDVCTFLLVIAFCETRDKIGLTVRNQSFRFLYNIKFTILGGVMLKGSNNFTYCLMAT